MASVDWAKMTMFKMLSGNMFIHQDSHARQTHNHANEQIDKSKTYLNWSTCSWDEARMACKARVEEVDKKMPPQRIRKDRVVCVGLYIPCPKELELNGKADDFFKEAYKAINDFFGPEDVHGMFVHKDEVHMYLMDGVEVESLEHAHVLVSAFTEEKGINGKAFETKERLHALNDLINDMVKEKFGIEYNTHGIARQQTVEAMKSKQKLLELQRDIEVKSEDLNGLERDICKAEEVKANFTFTKEMEKVPKGTTEALKAENKRLRDEVEHLKAEINKIDNYDEIKYSYLANGREKQKIHKKNVELEEKEKKINNIQEDLDRHVEVLAYNRANHMVDEEFRALEQAIEDNLPGMLPRLEDMAERILGRPIGQQHGYIEHDFER